MPMDLEKYSYLWAKDSSWMLSSVGDSYLILDFGQDGQMYSLDIEDNDLCEAVISKMKSEGVKIVTPSESDDLFKQLRNTHQKHSEKSKKLIEQAKQKLDDNQLIKIALKELLDNLDEVANKHTEIKDTMTRELLSDTISDYFVHDSATDNLPSDNYYAMFSDEGNDAVYQALIQFLTHPEVVAAREQLSTPEERLVVFQDDEVQSNDGTTYDWYFGWVSSL